MPVRADQRRNFLLFHRIQAESLFLFLLSLSRALDAFSPLSCGAEAEEREEALKDPQAPCERVATRKDKQRFARDDEENVAILVLKNKSV